MQENDSELCLMVTGTRRDGRRRYDPQSKRKLAEACLQPGVSLAGMALKHGVNANLLRKWVVDVQLESNPAPHGTTDDWANPFVPVNVAGRASAPIARSPLAPPAIAAGASARVVSTHLLRAQLPNGVTLEFECAAQDAALVSVVIDSLGRCDVPSGR